jgi:ribosomal protein L35AE/L33A
VKRGILVQTEIGRITNYRTGPKSQTSKECLVEFTNYGSASLAGKLIGQKVTWTNGSSKFVGKIMGAHGRNGTVRVKFPHGVPGQAIGTTVKLVS